MIFWGREGRERKTMKIKLDLEKVFNETEKGRSLARQISKMLYDLTEQAPREYGSGVLQHISVDEFWSAIESYSGGTGIAVFEIEMEEP
jgi:hypothetical protein